MDWHGASPCACSPRPPPRACGGGGGHTPRHTQCLWAEGGGAQNTLLDAPPPPPVQRTCSAHRSGQAPAPSGLQPPFQGPWGKEASSAPPPRSARPLMTEGGHGPVVGACPPLPPPPPPRPRGHYISKHRIPRDIGRGGHAVRDTPSGPVGPSRSPTAVLCGGARPQSPLTGYCRLQMPLELVLGVRGTVAGRRLGALEGGGGGASPPSKPVSGTADPRSSQTGQVIRGLR